MSITSEMDKALGVAFILLLYLVLISTAKLNLNYVEDKSEDGRPGSYPTCGLVYTRSIRRRGLLPAYSTLKSDYRVGHCVQGFIYPRYGWLYFFEEQANCCHVSNSALRFVLLNKPCVLDVTDFLDVQCRPALIWYPLSNLRGALFL